MQKAMPGASYLLGPRPIVMCNGSALRSVPTPAFDVPAADSARRDWYEQSAEAFVAATTVAWPNSIADVNLHPTSPTYPRKDSQTTSRVEPETAPTALDCLEGDSDLGGYGLGAALCLLTSPPSGFLGAFTPSCIGKFNAARGPLPRRNGC